MAAGQRQPSSRWRIGALASHLRRHLTDQTRPLPNLGTGVAVDDAGGMCQRRVIIGAVGFLDGGNVPPISQQIDAIVRHLAKLTQ
jgi:hypothetical protein